MKHGLCGDAEAFMGEIKCLKVSTGVNKRKGECKLPDCFLTQGGSRRLTGLCLPSVATSNKQSIQVECSILQQDKSILPVSAVL
jgi:hypothetical protein